VSESEERGLGERRDYGGDAKRKQGEARTGKE